MAVSDNLDFEIEIDFERDRGDPARIFRCLASFTDSMLALDHALAQSIDTKIEPFFVLDDIEAGSIRARFRTMVESIDDGAIRQMSWKQIVGAYLVKGKYRLLKWLEEEPPITEPGAITRLQAEIRSLAEETEVQWIPIFMPIPLSELVQLLQQINESVQPLTERDRITFYSAFGNARFAERPDIRRLVELLTVEVMDHTQEHILKVKKMDLLGNSQWEFRFDGRIINVTVLDHAWLRDFHNRRFDIRPGDAFRVTMRVLNHYGPDHEIIATHYELLKVIQVIPGSQPYQGPLLS